MSLTPSTSIASSRPSSPRPSAAVAALEGQWEGQGGEAAGSSSSDLKEKDEYDGVEEGTRESDVLALIEGLKEGVTSVDYSCTFMKSAINRSLDFTKVRYLLFLFYIVRLCLSYLCPSARSYSRTDT